MSNKHKLNNKLSDAYDVLDSLSESITEFVDDNPDDGELGEVLLSLNKLDGSVVEMYTVNDEFMATINIEFLDDLVGFDNSEYIKEELDQGNTVDVHINAEIVS